MHSQFKDISQRLGIMGDYAENEFRNFCNKEGIIALEFGFNKPPFEYFPQIPSLLRAMPDFFCETGSNRLLGVLPITEQYSQKRNPHRHFLCEVKGCGKDGAFKLKDETLEMLRIWQDITQRPVMFFLFDQPHDRVALISLMEIDQILPELERGYFVDSGKEKPFYKLTVKREEINWEPIV